MAYSPIAVGIGLSGFNPDYGHGHMLGGTLWIDYFPERLPSRLHGLGIEAEARDLNYGRSATVHAGLREDVGSGGVIYSWSRFRNFRPYGKFLMGFGNTDYLSTGPYAPPSRRHDSRTVTSMGGGLEFHAYRTIWVRADYEYQSWPDFFKHSNHAIPAGLLNPQGFTVGALYHFGGHHHSR
jgi:opacity protein-like surface antigen